MNYWQKKLCLTCCRGSRSPPVISRIVSCISPTVLTVQCKVVSNIFFKNRLEQSLTKFNFQAKIIRLSNICYFWRIFQCQLTSKHVCDNFLKQNIASYTTLPRSKPTSFSSSSNIAFKTHYVFFAIADQVK